MAPHEIVLYGTVGSSFWDEDFFTAKQVREQLVQMNGDIVVRINSGGGIASEGQAIYTMLSDHAGKVTVVIDGCAASAASLIAMAGDEIVVRRGAWMLIHDPAMPFTAGRGTEDDHLKEAEHLAVIAMAYADIYAARSGMSRDEARRIMKDETVLDGEMAVQLGFATSVEAAEAVPAAMFDYRMYAHAPEEVRKASKCLGRAPERRAVMAMMAGLPRKKEKPKMTEVTSETVTEETSATEETTAMETPAVVATEEPAAVDAATATIAERARAKRINDAVAAARLPHALASDLIGQGVTLEAALDKITAHWKENGDMDTPMPGRETARITRDERDGFKQGATLALMKKVGLTGGERNEFSALSLAEMARESIRMAGERTNFSDRREMIGRAFTMSGTHSTSDFANILSNVMGKAALQGWEEAQETYQLFTRPGVLTDFKPTRRVGPGLFASLPALPEGAEYTFGTVGDRGEPITLATYGRMLRITRQAVINDDLNQFGDLPRRMGRAARRTIGNLVYGVLTGNPTMSDSIALFNAAHGNLGTGAGSALSVASAGAAIAAMKVQQDAGSALNITPRYLIVPAALEMTARQLLNSTVDPGANRGHAMNPVANFAEMVVDARLDAASTTSWYLAADPNQFDTIEVAFLDGNDAPFIEEQSSWTTDGVELKVRIDAGVAPLDWRTLYRAVGA